MTLADAYAMLEAGHASYIARVAPASRGRFPASAPPYRPRSWYGDSYTPLSVITTGRGFRRPTLRIHRYSPWGNHVRYVEVATGKTITGARRTMGAR